MSDPMKQAWNDVSDGFSELGKLMKERYESARDDNVADADADADADTDADSDTDAERERGAALREAFDRLVSAGRDFGDRAADVARDDDIKVQARHAAARLNDALSATVDTIGEHVGGLFKKSTGGDRSAKVPATEPVSDDARQ
ncbi:MAG: hypothetical protein ACR2HQ_14070 [Ilumatobacteraceae bacterium]